MLNSFNNLSEDHVKIRVIHCEELSKAPKFNYDTQYLYPKLMKTHRYIIYIYTAYLYIYSRFKINFF